MSKNSNVIVKIAPTEWDREHYEAWQRTRAQIDNIYQCLREIDALLETIRIQK